jgi:hypothetical protein
VGKVRKCHCCCSPVYLALSLAYFTLVSVVVLVDLALILDIRKLCELYTEIVCTFALKDKISQGTNIHCDCKGGRGT